MRTIDLNLLIILRVLLEECHVSRAARRVSLSQPAMSRALGRLRSMFDDPLLVKSQHGLAPTERASRLLPSLQSILADISGLLEPPELKPSNMRGEIRIATRDNEMAVIMPEIIQQVAKQAPNLDLNVSILKGSDFSALEQHSVDFILCASSTTNGALHRISVHEEGYACLVDEKNPVAHKKFTLDDYVRLKHCLVTIENSGEGLVDEILAKQNLKRDVTVKVPYFLSVPFVISNSLLITTLPASLGELFAHHYPLKYIAPPLIIPKFEIYLYWHAKQHNNPIHRWIRRLFQNGSGSPISPR